eukprot:1159260-Pelagomonas_calceolata.AAC.9
MMLIAGASQQKGMASHSPPAATPAQGTGRDRSLAATCVGSEKTLLMRLWTARLLHVWVSSVSVLLMRVWGNEAAACVGEQVSRLLLRRRMHQALLGICAAHPECVARRLHRSCVLAHARLRVPAVAQPMQHRGGVCLFMRVPTSLSPS